MYINLSLIIAVVSVQFIFFMQRINFNQVDGFAVSESVLGTFL